MAGMLASLIRTVSQTADYWALNLQMETQTGWKMVYQRYSGSLMAGTWANLRSKDSPMA